MFTVVMATFVSRKLSAESIYTEKLRRRGIRARLTGGILLQDLKHALSHSGELNHAYHVSDFKHDIAPVRVTESLDTVVDRFAETGLDRLVVVDGQGRLVGGTAKDIKALQQHI